MRPLKSPQPSLCVAAPTSHCRCRAVAVWPAQDASRTELEKSIKMAAVVVDQLIKSSGGEASFDLSTIESEGNELRSGCFALTTAPVGCTGPSTTRPCLCAHHTHGCAVLCYRSVRGFSGAVAVWLPGLVVVARSRRQAQGCWQAGSCDVALTRRDPWLWKPQPMCYHCLYRDCTIRGAW